MLRGSLFVLCFSLLRSFVLVSDMLSHCPYLWGLRLFQIDLAFDASHASEFDICFYMAFVHLDMSFTCLSITWMGFSAFTSQTISCDLMLSTHSARGRFRKSSWYEPWYDSDECLTNCWNDFDDILGVHDLWEFCMSLLLCAFMSFMVLCVSHLLCASWWVLWDFVCLFCSCASYVELLPLLE